MEEQLWPAWKLFFKPLYLTLERKSIAATGQPDMFGTAASAQAYYSIVMVAPRANDVGKIEATSIMEHLNGRFRHPRVRGHE